jgi:uncharacterized protein (DUF2147 family)
LGRWLSEDKEGVTEIFELNGKFYGKLVWLKNPTDEKGIPFTDSNNPDTKLQKKPLIGLTIINDLVYKNQKWGNGTVYDPEEGKTYQCVIWLKDNNTMNIRGYWGFVYSTETWTRMK